jgi:hypothetical protein
MKALSGGDRAGKICELNGPEALTYTELAAKIEKQSLRLHSEARQLELLTTRTLRWAGETCGQFRGSRITVPT